MYILLRTVCFIHRLFIDLRALVALTPSIANSGNSNFVSIHLHHTQLLGKTITQFAWCVVKFGEVCRTTLLLLPTVLTYVPDDDCYWMVLGYTERSH